MEESGFEPARVVLYDVAGLLGRGVMAALLRPYGPDGLNRTGSEYVAFVGSALLAFAELDIRAGGKRPPGIDSCLPGSMQLAEAGVASICSLVATDRLEAITVTRVPDNISCPPEIWCLLHLQLSCSICSNGLPIPSRQWQQPQRCYRGH